MEDNSHDEEYDQEDGNDDLKEYMREMEQLKTDFSDLEDLDLDEIEEMKEAIAFVQDTEDTTELETQSTELGESEVNRDTKESMMMDFSDLGKMDLNELLEMRQAITSVQEDIALKEEDQSDTSTTDGTDDLEKIIQKELEKKKEEKEVITEEKFTDYLKNKRDKIWYHAIYYIAFETEDYIASKELLYDMLKEDTSKSAIDPIQEHQFYFGLGYLLRLKVNERQVVRYYPGGKFKINIAPESLKNMLEEAGNPIITKPTIAEDKQKKMFKDFLDEDFSEY